MPSLDEIAPNAEVELIPRRGGPAITPSAGGRVDLPTEVAAETPSLAGPSLGIRGRCWTFAHFEGSPYADIEGQSYHYDRRTRAARDSIANGDWVICHRSLTETPDRAVIFAVARVGQVHRCGDDRYATYDRYCSVDPPRPWTWLSGGDPRAVAQNPINPIEPAVVEELLLRSGVERLDDVPVPSMTLSLKRVFEAASEIRLPVSVVQSAVAALRSGKHLILTGPPGTGKSTLAVALAQAATSAGLSGPALVTTGTADWTTTDTVGGYRLDPDAGRSDMGGLVFAPGLLLEAIKADSWLVIDELNRADIDKAIGSFFSVLSGQPVVLPFVDEERQHYSIVPPGIAPPPGTTPFRVSSNWRLVATMNERDRDLLFTLSEAFMRRFAVIHVPSPSREEDWEWILKNRATVRHDSLAERLARLARLPNPKIGPAIVIDAARYLEHRLAMTYETCEPVDPVAVMSDAVDALVRPQLVALFGEDEARARRYIEREVLHPERPTSGSAVASQAVADEQPVDEESSLLGQQAIDGLLAVDEMGDDRERGAL